MKNKIILVILIAMMFCLCGCSSESVAVDCDKDRLVIIDKEGKYTILVDTETNVEYLQYRERFYTGGAGGITPLLNTDGTPLLYGGKINE